MTIESEGTSFSVEPDPEIGGLLREYTAAPDAGFLTRMEAVVSRLPDTRSPLDVLGQWARPRVLAVAMAAGFILGALVWQQWQASSRQVASSTAMLLEASREGGQSVVFAAMMENQ